MSLFLALSNFQHKLTSVSLSFKNPKSDPSKWLTGVELAALYSSYTQKYDIISIEDPFDQDDWEAWTHLTRTTAIQIVGGEPLLLDHSH